MSPYDVSWVDWLGLIIGLMCAVVPVVAAGFYIFGTPMDREEMRDTLGRFLDYRDNYTTDKKERE